MRDRIETVPEVFHQFSGKPETVAEAWLVAVNVIVPPPMKAVRSLLPLVSVTVFEPSVVLDPKLCAEGPWKSTVPGLVNGPAPFTAAKKTV